MKNKTIIIIIVIVVILVIVLIIGSNSYTKKSVCGNGIVEKGETKENCCIDVGCFEGYECIDNKCMKFSVAPAPIFDKVIIEGTIISNLSTEFQAVKNGVNGTLHGIFTKVRVDKIINHTRYDPRNELGFNPLVVGDTINVSLHECFHKIGELKNISVENISINDKILINIFTEGPNGGIIWLDECN